MIGLARTVAKEAAARAIRVNVLAPGSIDNAIQTESEDRITDALGRDATELIDSRIPLGRHACAEEVAGSVLFLALSKSCSSTGKGVMADCWFTV